MNVEYARDFGDLLTLRGGHGGWYIDIYVRRLTVNAGATAGAFDNIETSNAFYFLKRIQPTEVDVAGNDASFIWRGVEKPDLMQPLPQARKFGLYEFYPKADQEYILDFDVSKMPPRLQDIEQALPVTVAALPAFDAIFMSYLCEFDGADRQAALSYQEEYKELVAALRENNSDQGNIVTSSSLLDAGEIIGEVGYTVVGDY